MKILLPPALDALGLPTPVAVTEAVEFRREAERLLTELRETPPPRLEDATKSTVADMVETSADHELRHPVRVRHAAHLVDIAETRVAQAWEEAAQALRPKLADGFNDAAKTLEAEATKCPTLDPETIGYQRSNPLYRNLFAAADKLSILAAVRDGLAAQTPRRAEGLHSATYEALSRCLTLTTMREVSQPSFLNAAKDPGFWLAAAHRPGVSIHWNEPVEQAAHLARIKMG